ncbi:MAG: magnesium/cobalt transporter CorA [Psychrobacter sp.]
MENNNDQLIKKTARIAPDSNIDRLYSDMKDEHLYLDNEESYIYGDKDATNEDTIETMTVYDPDSERYEDIDSSSEDEVVNCYSYSRKTGEKLDRLALNDVSRALSNSGQFIWLGLYDPSLETMVKIKDAFGLHELAIEDAFADHQRAKVENYDNDMVFVVLRTAKLEDNVIRYGTTAIFMGKNYLITIRNGPSNSYAPVREHCHRRPEKLRMGPIFVLHAILDFIVDNYMPITDRLGRYLREQERYVFTYEFDKSTLKNLYKLKSQLVHMRAIILPVQDICSFFINHKKSELVSGFSQAAKPYFRDVNDHLLHSLDAINGLNEMLSVMMNTYMAMVDMGQNEVVRKLAAWAGILAVPTAIAGVYGMNFDFMPELHWRYSYFVIMVIIGGLCGFLYYNFKRLKWL